MKEMPYFGTPEFSSLLRHLNTRYVNEKFELTRSIPTKAVKAVKAVKVAESVKTKWRFDYPKDSLKISKM